jgi:stage III sporulation protein AG
MSKFNNILKDLKRRFTKYGSKKVIEKAVIIAIVGVICLIAGSVLFEGSTTKEVNGKTLGSSGNVQTVQTINQSNEAPNSEMEKSLQLILSKIKGAGKVDVMITFFSGNESIPALDVKTSENDTQEKDKEGGSRIIKQSDIENKTIYEENQGVKKPFIVKELLPKVKGVVIVADGAEDTEVKINLAKATEALLDIAAHKIQVFQRSSN